MGVAPRPRLGVRGRRSGRQAPSREAQREGPAVGQRPGAPPRWTSSSVSGALPARPRRCSSRASVAASASSLRGSSRWMSVRLPASRRRPLAEHAIVEFVAADEPVSAADGRVARRLPTSRPSTCPRARSRAPASRSPCVDSGVAPHPDIQTLIAAVDFTGRPRTARQLRTDAVRRTASTRTGMARTWPASWSATAAVPRTVGWPASRRWPTSSRCACSTASGRGQTSDVLAGLQWILANKDAVRHPRRQPLARASRLRARRGRPARAGGGRAVGRRGRGGVLGRQRRAQTDTCTDHQPLQLAQGDHRRRDQRPPDRGHLRRHDHDLLVAGPDGARPRGQARPRRAGQPHRVAAVARARTSTCCSPSRRVAADPSQPAVQEYYEMSGTSMAAPIVAGTVALMLEQDPALNPGTVKARLMLSARKPASGDPFVTGAGAAGHRRRPARHRHGGGCAFAEGHPRYGHRPDRLREHRRALGQRRLLAHVAVVERRHLDGPFRLRPGGRLVGGRALADGRDRGPRTSSGPTPRSGPRTCCGRTTPRPGSPRSRRRRKRVRSRSSRSAPASRTRNAGAESSVHDSGYHESDSRRTWQCQRSRPSIPA